MKHIPFISILASLLIQAIPSLAQTNPFGYTTPPDTTSASTDPVGSINGSFAVSPLGAATYTIPIECPQGLPGMTPQVAITYNSQAGNGVAGYGCSISGISVITRVPRDIFHDGAASGISYTADDAFSLDGQRLILTQAAAGSDSAVYCLENDPYMRIVLHGLNGPSQSRMWFSTVSRDGISYEYGTSATARRATEGISPQYVEAWYVCKVTNPVGNYIEYEYVKKSQLQTQYNAFGKVSQIRDYGEDNYKMLFDYGPDNERWRTRLYRNTSTLQRTTYYMGDYEEIIEGGTTRRLYYLGGDVLYKKQTSQPDSVFYLFTDHLGSVVLIVDQNGSEKFRATYDAWGNQTVTRNDIGFHRGYTGHEMLPEFGLINMNGRLYDPQIGRFLSTDNYVQEPWNSQNFNRYSYCLNNPLKYTDPSGELAWFIPVIAGAVIGAALSGTTYTLSTWLSGNSWQPTAFWKSIGIGAFSGALGGVIGYTGTLLNTAGNNVGFNILGQVSNTVVTNTVFNENTGVNDMLGIAFGSLIGSALPKYTPSGKSLFSNAIKETLVNTGRGGITGFTRGVIDYAIKGDKKYLYEDFIGGVISGFSRSMLNNIIMGVPYASTNIEGQKVTFRTGGLFQLLYDFHKKTGITLGSNANVKNKDIDTQNHEYYHFFQEQSKEYGGWSGFYGTYFFELFKHFGKNLYTTPGTIEYKANEYEMQMRRARYGN